jgi:uncharacterized RDD family membrane protein YckC
MAANRAPGRGMPDIIVTDIAQGGDAAKPALDLDAAALDGVRRKRVFAFIDDLLVITLIYATSMLALGLAGVVPPGRPWLFAPPLYPLIAIVYNAATIARSRTGTPGMRMVGLRMTLRDGRPAPVLNVVAHALFFYLGLVLLTPLVLLVGLLSPQKRFLHDRGAEVFITNVPQPD